MWLSSCFAICPSMCELDPPFWCGEDVSKSPSLFLILVPSFVSPTAESFASFATPKNLALLVPNKTKNRGRSHTI